MAMAACKLHAFLLNTCYALVLLTNSRASRLGQGRLAEYSMLSGRELGR